MSSLARIHWLSSYPKSGNTWVRALLYAYKFGTVSLQQMKGHVTGDQSPGAWFAASPVPWGLLTSDQRILIRYTALMTTAAISIQDVCIIKTHCANIRVNSVDLIPEELTGQSVYLVRDPRDVAISYAHHMGLDIDEAIKRMGTVGCSLNSEDVDIIQPTGSWSVSVKSWYEDGIFERSIIRYEDLMKDTGYELTHILECFYPDVEVDQERVKQAVKLCEFEKLKRMEQEDGFHEASKNGEFFRKGKSTWQEVLTDEQVKQIESDHGEWMVKMNYELAMEKAA